MKVDANGFVTARATVVPFRPPSHPLAFDVAERDGGGRYVVHPDDLHRVKLWDGCTVRYHPQDQFARVVEPQLAPLPWEVTRCPECGEPAHASETDDEGRCAPCRSGIPSNAAKGGAA